METSGRLLLLLLFASGLCLSSPVEICAQAGDKVSLRPRVTAPQTGMPQVTATADRDRVPLGDDVMFTLSPAMVISDPRYRVTLNFGDGRRQVLKRSEIVHLYAVPGNYTYSVSVEPLSQATPFPMPQVPVPNVSLAVSPPFVQTNRIVTYSARLSHPYPNLRFRFVFGDGSQTDWQTDSRATHVYRSANTFETYVDIGIAASGSITQAGGSKRQLIQVAEPLRPASLAVRLITNSNAIDANEVVKFSAQVDPSTANTRYRFDFGDKAATEWQSSAEATHQYKSAGKYSARVEARTAGPVISPTANSNDVTIEVKPPLPAKVE